MEKDRSVVVVLFSCVQYLPSLAAHFPSPEPYAAAYGGKQLRVDLRLQVMKNPESAGVTPIEQSVAKARQSWAGPKYRRFLSLMLDILHAILWATCQTQFASPLDAPFCHVNGLPSVPHASSMFNPRSTSRPDHHRPSLPCACAPSPSLLPAVAHSQLPR